MNPDNDNKDLIVDDLDFELPKTKEENSIELDTIEIEEEQIDEAKDISPTVEIDTLEKEEQKEKVIDEKPKKEKRPGGFGLILRKIVSLIIWLAILGIVATWVVDYVMVQQEKEPMFCIDKKTHTFADGTVEECVGLGYKVYTYDRASFKATEFGPIFIEMREE